MIAPLWTRLRATLDRAVAAIEEYVLLIVLVLALAEATDAEARALLDQALDEAKD